MGYGYYPDALLDACVEAYLNGVHESDDGNIIVVETTVEERQKFGCSKYVSIRQDENGMWEIVRDGRRGK